MKYIYFFTASGHIVLTHGKASAKDNFNRLLPIAIPRVDAVNALSQMTDMLSLAQEEITLVTNDGTAKGNKNGGPKHDVHSDFIVAKTGLDLYPLADKIRLRSATVDIVTVSVQFLSELSNGVKESAFAHFWGLQRKRGEQIVSLSMGEYIPISVTDFPQGFLPEALKAAKMVKLPNKSYCPG